MAIIVAYPELGNSAYWPDQKAFQKSYVGVKTFIHFHQHGYHWLM